MNLNQRMAELERKIDLLLAARDIEPNPGVTTVEGRTFAQGSGPIAEYTPPPDQPAVNPSAFVAQARRALTPNPTGDTP